MKRYLIYKHTSPSGKIYIGKTKFTLEKRWKEHCYIAYNKNHSLYNKHFYKAIRKYGPENFTHEVIVDNLPDYFVNAFERYWIWKTNAISKGYNYGIGGEGHVSDTQKQATIQSNKTRKVSKATKSKISKAAKGRVYSQEIYNRASRKKSTPVDIICYKTNIVLYENVYLFEWLRDNPSYSKSSLTKTANPKSRVKQHLGLYIKWRTKI